MTSHEFALLPPLLSAHQVRELGVPRGVLSAVAEPIAKSDQQVPFGKIGFICLPSTRATSTGLSRRLYLKSHVARFLGDDFSQPQTRNL
jgi:hypothetical protein